MLLFVRHALSNNEELGARRGGGAAALSEGGAAAGRNMLVGDLGFVCVLSLRSDGPGGLDFSFFLVTVG